jgi:hypothetical protein
MKIMDGESGKFRENRSKEKRFERDTCLIY